MGVVSTMCLSHFRSVFYLNFKSFVLLVIIVIIIIYYFYYYFFYVLLIIIFEKSKKFFQQTKYQLSTNSAIVFFSLNYWI